MRPRRGPGCAASGTRGQASTMVLPCPSNSCPALMLLRPCFVFPASSRLSGSPGVFSRVQAAPASKISREGRYPKSGYRVGAPTGVGAIPTFTQEPFRRRSQTPRVRTTPTVQKKMAHHLYAARSIGQPRGALAPHVDRAAPHGRGRRRGPTPPPPSPENCKSCRPPGDEFGGPRRCLLFASKRRGVAKCRGPGPEAVPSPRIRAARRRLADLRVRPPVELVLR